jgi:hypothetical protein
MLALYSLYHFPSGDGYVHAVTAAVNRIHRENGETRLSSPKTVGRILNKSLGFPTRRRGEGYRVELSGAGRKIHQQAKAMGITHSDILSTLSVESRIVSQSCDLCAEFGMMTDHEGRRLLTFDELETESTRCPSCGLYSHHEQCPRCKMQRQAEPSSRVLADKG